MKFQPILILLTFLFAFPSLFHAQHTSRQLVRLDDASTALSRSGNSTDQPYLSDFIPVSIEAGDSPFFAVYVRWAMTDPSLEPAPLQIRFNPEEPWSMVTPDPHATFKAPLFISSLFFTQPANRQFQVLLPGHLAPAQIQWMEIVFFAPGATPANSRPAGRIVGEKSFCPCPLPEIQYRNDWCPSGDCPVDPTPQPTTVTHLIVHHSAGTNTASDWAAVVRSIWEYHVNGNGWDDIGYNWLVDPNGVLYEGRGNNLQGAHFCGQNGGTAGICVLGNFMTQAPQPAAVEALITLLAWKSCEANIDPLDFSFHPSSGLNLFHISGHRDGCSTACPGDVFYNTYFNSDNPMLRNGVADFIASSCSNILPPSNLEGSSPDETTVFLTWIDQSDNETHFSLERSISGAEDYSEIALLDAETESYQDDGLTPGVYDYRARALNDVDTSLYSNVATISTFPSSAVQPGKALSFSAYPNPFEDILVLELEEAPEGKLSTSWYTIDGKRLTNMEAPTRPGEKVLTFSTAHLPPGIYFLKMVLHDQTGAIRLIKR